MQCRHTCVQAELASSASLFRKTLLTTAGAYLLRGAEAKHLGDLRVCFLVVVSHAHAAAHRDIEALQLAVFHNGDVAQAVRKHIDCTRERSNQKPFVEDEHGIGIFRCLAVLHNCMLQGCSA